MESTAGQTLADPKLDGLLDLIKDSFRVHPNEDPIYVDAGGSGRRVLARQHQVIFGRRGSGKSCLLVHTRKIAKQNDALAVYMNADSVKSLGYPDVLIRVLLEICKGIRRETKAHRRIFSSRFSALKKVECDLRVLLDKPEESDTRTEVQRSGKTGASVTAPVGPVHLGIDGSAGSTESTVEQFRSKKLDHVDRHLDDYKDAIQAAVKKSGKSRALIMLDDFYLIPKIRQPDVLDYVHRLLRGTDAYLKVGTVRHRTVLNRQRQQTVGVVLDQDVEAIDLDRTLADLGPTQAFLGSMLESLGKEKGIESAHEKYFNADALQSLTLASGGVPRDFLNIFVDAVAVARQTNKRKWLTNTTVYKGAAQISVRSKVDDLKRDAGTDASALASLFDDLYKFCINEKKSTVFLVAHTDKQAHRVEHELIQQLTDCKLVHLVDENTSAASGRPGRFEAYTLDFATFMEPRRRGIDIVEFWRRSDQGHLQGVRESPVYPLLRVREVLESGALKDPDSVISDLEAQNKIDPAEDAT